MIDTIPADLCPHVMMSGHRCDRPRGHGGHHTSYNDLRAPDAADGATLHGVHTSTESLLRSMPYGDPNRTGRFTMSDDQFTITTIAKPRHVRDGSITDAQVDAVFEAFATGRVPEGEAVVICRGMDKENTARNRARTLAERVKDRHGKKDSYKALAAHAIADPDADGKFVGAVSLKPTPKPKKDTTAPATAAAKK